MSERVIRAVAEHPTLMPCFNVPFQSGDTEILRLMRRGYTRERYIEIITRIREIIPDAAITADCIVGFPSETEEQFQNSLSLMKLFKFDLVNTAAYSPRPGTPAAEWENQLPQEIKEDRLKRINELVKEHALERSKRFLNQIQPILVEDINLKNINQVYGRNPQNKLVYFDGNIDELKGKIVDVKVTEAFAYYLMGERVKSL
jgi:tRNA-2-methylthio-N6-dimethylallyladenosine synthase